eukprot:3231683-Pyramimonas_sp.AAC.1
MEVILARGSESSAPGSSASSRSSSPGAPGTSLHSHIPPSRRLASLRDSLPLFSSLNAVPAQRGSDANATRVRGADSRAQAALAVFAYRAQGKT